MNEQTGYPDDNPKTAVGATKTPLWLVPASATYHLADAFADGAIKYGPYNWREKTVSASVYVSAARRHIDDWLDGEDFSRDANVHHLAHAMACMAILLDAMSVGKLNDDRPPKGAAADLHEKFANKKKESIDGGSEASEACLVRTPHGNTVELCGVRDLQTNLFPSDPNGDGYFYYGYDGQYEYWSTPDGGVVRYDPASGPSVSEPTVSRLFRERGSTFNSLYDLTEGDGSGSLPVATRNEDG